MLTLPFPAGHKNGDWLESIQKTHFVSESLWHERCYWNTSVSGERKIYKNIRSPAVFLFSLTLKSVKLTDHTNKLQFLIIRWKFYQEEEYVLMENSSQIVNISRECVIIEASKMMPLHLLTDVMYNWWATSKVCVGGIIWHLGWLFREHFRKARDSWTRILFVFCLAKFKVSQRTEE